MDGEAVLASKANFSVKRCVTKYWYFSVYLKSVKLVLPCVSSLGPEFMNLKDHMLLFCLPSVR